VAAAPRPGGAPGESALAAVRDLPGRRQGAQREAAGLRERRDEADPARGDVARPGREDMPAPGGPETAQRLLPARALEAVALAAGTLGDRAYVEVRLGSELGVRLTRAPTGVEVVLEAAPSLRRAAEAELPGLLAALRARGLSPARAEVRERGRRPSR